MDDLIFYSCLQILLIRGALLLVLTTALQLSLWLLLASCICDP